MPPTTLRSIPARPDKAPPREATPREATPREATPREATPRRGKRSAAPAWGGRSGVVLALALVLTALLPAAHARADDPDSKPRPRRFGNVVFVLPADWSAGDGGSVAGVRHCLVRPDDRPSRDDGSDGFYPDLTWVEGEPFSGDTDALKAWATRRMTAQAAVPEGETVKVIEDKWIDAKNATGPRTLFGLAATTRDDGNGGTEIARVLPFIALRAGGRAELAYADVAREHAGLVGETGENHQPEAVEALAALVDSATFVGLGAEPLEPPPVPGDLDGVYRGTSIFWTVGMNAQMVADVTHPTITFFADGTFADGLPPGGLNGFDYADAAMSHTDEVGTYRRSTNANGGPTVELHFASGEVEEYAGSDGSLPGAVTRPDGTILVPVGVAPDGWTFDGERSTSFVQTTGFAGSGTFSAVSGGSSIRFRKDGTAESDRWSAFSSNTETGDARTGAAGANESPVAPARYAIDGGILTLTAPDGSATTYAALITDEPNMDGEGTITTLVLGGKPASVAGPLPEPVTHTPKYAGKDAANPLGGGASNPLSD